MDHDAVVAAIHPVAAALRPASAAFDDSSDGSPMSVVLESKAIELGRGPNDVLLGHAGFGLVRFQAGIARACGQGIARDPTPDEPAHAVVFGKKPKSVQRKIRSASEWVVLPEE